MRPEADKDTVPGLVARLARMFAAIVVGLTFLAMKPDYSEPFAGCEAKGFGILTGGCSFWPDLVFGMGAVLLIALIGPNRLKPHLWGFFMIVVLTVLGGLPSIKDGSWSDVFVQPSISLEYWLSHGGAMVMGGFIGCVVFICLSRAIEKKRPIMRFCFAAIWSGLEVQKYWHFGGTGLVR